MTSLTTIQENGHLIEFNYDAEVGEIEQEEEVMCGDRYFKCSRTTELSGSYCTCISTRRAHRSAQPVTTCDHRALLCACPMLIASTPGAVCSNADFVNRCHVLPGTIRFTPNAAKEAQTHPFFVTVEPIQWVETAENRDDVGACGGEFEYGATLTLTPHPGMPLTAEQQAFVDTFELKPSLSEMGVV